MLAPGTQIWSRYSIVKALGRGGMGAVYLARTLAHPDLPSDLKPDTAVAIKQVLCSHLEGEERLRAREAFEQEANLLARLRHPGLVRIFEHLVGDDESYLVMEYVDGLTLSQICRRLDSPLPFARVQYVAHQLCQVLGYLHQLDPPVIFRDLKPSNIMVDRTYKITLIDFGIARVFEEESRTQTFLRGVGSAGYAPLEQYAGGTDPRSDVYSLGATLYTLLTKLVPPPAALRVVGSEEIQEIEALNPHAPPHWRKAVRKMLRLRREERYPTVAAVERVLFAGEADETTSLLMAPKVTVDLANAVLVQRLGLRRPDVAFQVRGAPYQEQDQAGLPADVVLCLKQSADEQCGLSVVLSNGIRKAPSFELGVDYLAVYLVPDGDKLAPPQMVMPGVRSALREFAPKALRALATLSASESNLKTIAQLSSLLSCGEAAEQAARLEMQWRMALKIARPQDWMRLAQNLRQYRREAAEEFLGQAFAHWQESAREWNQLPVRQALPQHQLLLEELKSLESDGRFCVQWLDLQSAPGRAAFRDNWLSLELHWRQSFPQFGEAERADCLLAMAQHLMDQAEYSRAEPLATTALQLAEKTLGPDNPSLSPYLRLYANVCDHCGMSKKSTEFRTRALLLKHRRPHG